jgi:hypothetical protein
MKRNKSSRVVKKMTVTKMMPEDLNTIALPAPTFNDSVSVQTALKKRRTIRTVSEKKLPMQAISNLLWAANGINRKKGSFGMAGRTAASASNSQEIDIFVALQDGIFLYDAPSHTLNLVVTGDFRALAIGAGQKGAGAQAPIRLIYVVDIEKFKNAGFQEPGLWDPETQKAYYYVDTGLIAGNVYLFAAAYGLAAWFHNCDRVALTKQLKLRPTQRILFGQTVAKPAKATPV